MPQANPALMTRHQETIHQVQLTFVIACGGLGMTIASIMPSLAYAIMCYASMQMFHHFNPNTLHFPRSTLNITLAASTILLGGLAFSFMLPMFSQALTTLIVTTLLSWCYIHEILLPEQTQRNQALLNAAHAKEHETVNQLLQEGADPYYRHAQKSAFDDTTQAIQQSLLTPTPQPSLKMTLAYFKRLATPGIQTAWSHVYQAAKQLRQQDTPEHRDALKNTLSVALSLQHLGFKACLNRIGQYLQSQMRAPVIPAAQIPPPQPDNALLFESRPRLVPHHDSLAEERRLIEDPTTTSSNLNRQQAEQRENTIRARVSSGSTRPQ